MTSPLLANLEKLLAAAPRLRAALAS